MLDSPPAKPTKSQEAFLQLADQAVGLLASFRRSLKTTHSLAGAVQTDTLSADQHVFFQRMTRLSIAYPTMIGRFNELLAILNSNWSYVRAKFLFNSSLWPSCTPTADSNSPFILPIVQIQTADNFLIAEAELIAASRNLAAIRIDHSKFDPALREFSDSLTNLASRSPPISSYSFRLDTPCHIGRMTFCQVLQI